jgi:hypothetical protein
MAEVLLVQRRARNIVDGLAKQSRRCPQTQDMGHPLRAAWSASVRAVRAVLIPHGIALRAACRASIEGQDAVTLETPQRSPGLGFDRCAAMPYRSTSTSTAGPNASSSSGPRAAQAMTHTSPASPAGPTRASPRAGSAGRMSTVARYISAAAELTHTADTKGKRQVARDRLPRRTRNRWGTALPAWAAGRRPWRGVCDPRATP